jgi:hypothetical protein
VQRRSLADSPLRLSARSCATQPGLTPRTGDREGCLGTALLVTYRGAVPFMHITSAASLGPFRLVRQLGRGSFAPVWLADESTTAVLENQSNGAVASQLYKTLPFGLFVGVGT